MAMDLKTVNIKLDSEKAEAFKTRCAASGVKVTCFLRGAIEHFIATGEVPFELGEDLTYRRRLGVPNNPKANA
jgi:antitoxin component of RelBE/YafQ-DinJ toxin-antitoxin module